MKTKALLNQVSVVLFHGTSQASSFLFLLDHAST